MIPRSERWKDPASRLFLFLWFITGETLAVGNVDGKTGNGSPMKVKINLQYTGLDDRIHVF